MQRKVPRMTRGHYILIADTINKLCFKPEQKKFIAEVFADELRATNCNFKRERFMERACKPHKTPQEYAEDMAKRNAAMLRRTAKQMRAMLPESQKEVA